MSNSRLTTLLNNLLTVNQSKQIHACLIISSLHHLQSILVREILVSATSYSRNVAQYVRKMLYHSKTPDSFSWSCMVRYLSQHRQFRESVCFYVELQKFGLFPNTHAVSSALRACARIECREGGIMIHGQVYRYGFCGFVYVETAVLDFYTKLGDMVTASRVFREMPVKNVVSWNSVLSGYLKCGNIEEAHKVFDEIPEKDVVSWNAILSGFARTGKMDEAASLFQKMPEKNLASWNTMISGYAECGEIESARRLFDTMPRRNVVSWITMISGYSKHGDVASARELFDQIGEKDQLSYNAIISCYAQNSKPKEALELFNQMLEASTNIQPDEMTLASVISACSQLGELRFVPWIESCINNLGIPMNDYMTTALIDLYAKCGSISKAFELFQCLKKKDVVAYTAMILGCGINGKVDDAVTLFKTMVDSKVRPNLATFTGLLTAYSHAGLVKEGYTCFSSIKDHGLMPSTDHHAIMVDLLGRAGRLEEAYELIQTMPMQPHIEVWGALLHACNLHNNVEFGEIAARHCFEMEPTTTAYYSLLANIYASVGRWDDARRLRKVVSKKKLVKAAPGCSWRESS